MNAYTDIFEQYLDQAAFLWVLRDIAIHQPHYSIDDIYQLDQRIEAQLDGLTTNMELAWDCCLSALELQESGEVFTAAIIAFKSHDAQKIQKVVETGLVNDETVKGLISAMAWLPGTLIKPWIDKFLSSKDLSHKYLAIASCSARREDPENGLTRILQREDCQGHLNLYCASLKLIGEMKRHDLLHCLIEASNSKQKEVLFWANWSAILLGKKSAIAHIEPFAFNRGKHQMAAIDIALRSLTVEQSRNWISRLAKDTDQTRTVIKATGILGDPHAVSWLIQLMSKQESARLAAEMFSQITGLDLDSAGLSTEPPENYQFPDELDLDEDENLPWPDALKITEKWHVIQHQFKQGKRYILGHEINIDTLTQQLKVVKQRQRHKIIMELALLNSNSPILNIEARVQI